MIFVNEIPIGLIEYRNSLTPLIIDFENGPISGLHRNFRVFFTGNVHEEALGNVFLRKYPLYSSKDCQ